jgi:hypothetical protein
LLSLKAESRPLSTATAVPRSSWLKRILLFGLPLSAAAYLYDGITRVSAHEHDEEVPLPGQDKSMMSRVLDTASSWVQKKAPVKSIHNYLCALHFYNGDVDRQIVAHHYCHHLNEDVHQCVIYDSNAPNARLIGVEYIISERLFKLLPEEERKYWHSHSYEVKSGMLVAPGVPDIAEKREMEHLVNTYGKTWHFWQVDKGDLLPFGPPQLMMALTRDELVDQQLLYSMQRDLGIDGMAKRKQRRDLEVHKKLPGADAWEHGEAYQTVMKRVPMKEY